MLFTKIHFYFLVGKNTFGKDEDFVFLEVNFHLLFFFILTNCLTKF